MGTVRTETMSDEEETKKRAASEEPEEEAAEKSQKGDLKPAKKKKKRVESEEDSDSGVGSEVEDVSDASGDIDLDTSNIIQGPRVSRRSAQAAREVIAKKNATFTDESEEDSD